MERQKEVDGSGNTQKSSNYQPMEMVKWNGKIKDGEAMHREENLHTSVKKINFQVREESSGSHLSKQKTQGLNINSATFIPITNMMTEKGGKATGQIYMEENDTFKRHENVHADMYNNLQNNFLQPPPMKGEIKERNYWPKVPYVYEDENGFERTANTDGYWTNMLVLEEILEYLGGKEKAWKIVEWELKRNPFFGVHWFSIRLKPYEEKTPRNFRFGDQTNMMRVKKIIEENLPYIRIKVEHCNICYLKNELKRVKKECNQLPC